MSQDDNLYKEFILDLYRNPLNKKKLEDFDVEHKELNPLCGDEISIQIKFDKDKVVDIGHQGDGCAISQAVVSLLTDEVKGKTKKQILRLTEKDIYDLLGIEEVIYTRKKCALLGLKTIQKAI